MDDSRRRDSSSEPSWIEGFELFCHRAVNEESIFMNYFFKNVFKMCFVFRCPRENIDPPLHYFLASLLESNRKDLIETVSIWNVVFFF